MKRYICVFLLASFLLFSSSACNRQSDLLRDTAPGDEIHRSEDILVTHIASSDQKGYTCYLYAPLTDEIVRQNTTAIFSGSVSNVREAQVEYEYMDHPVTNNITLFDVSVSKVIKGNLKIGSTVTVGVSYNSLRYGERLPLIKEGSSYLMFCNAPLRDDPRERSRYVDFWVEYSNELLLERIGDYYLSTEFFSEYAPSGSLVSEFGNLSDGNLADYAGMSFRDIVMSQPFRNIGKDHSDTMRAVLQIAKERTFQGSAEFSILMKSSYLIPCAELERSLTLAYD